MRISAIFSIALVAAISLAASFTTPSGKVLQLPDVPTEYAAGSDFIPQELLQLESTKGVHADGAGRTDQWFLVRCHFLYLALATIALAFDYLLYCADVFG